MQIAPNCTRILAECGLLDEVRELGVLPQRIVMKDAVDGTVLSRLDLRDVERRYGFPYLVIHRSDLHGALLRSCERAGVDLVTGAQVTAYSQTRDGAVAVHRDGSETAGRIVIAADRLRSTARTLFSDDGGLGYPDELDAPFAGTCAQVRTGLHLMWRDRWWGMYDRDPIMTWTQGRIALAGDAAHPPRQSGPGRGDGPRGRLGPGRARRERRADRDWLSGPTARTPDQEPDMFPGGVRSSRPHHRCGVARPGMRHLASTENYLHRR